MFHQAMFDCQMVHEHTPNFTDGSAGLGNMRWWTQWVGEDVGSQWIHRCYRFRWHTAVSGFGSTFREQWQMVNRFEHWSACVHFKMFTIIFMWHLRLFGSFSDTLPRPQPTSGVSCAGAWSKASSTWTQSSMLISLKTIEALPFMDWLSEIWLCNPSSRAIEHWLHLHENGKADDDS